MTAPRLAGWVPVRFSWREGRSLVDWCYLGDRRFTEPFFGDTIRAALRLPFNLVFRHQTPVEVLLEWQDRQPGVPSAGFIFHTSRCGSTLVAQMLAALPRHVVLSEADPIDGVLRAPPAGAPASEADRCTWLRAMVSALGQQRSGAETHLFVKFDCWHTLDLPLIRQAFPEVPWVFVYRDPVEVLVSQLRQRGAYLVPGLTRLTLPGVDQAEAALMAPEEYCARMLACLYGAALDQARDGGLLVNYRQLPEAACSSIADLFGAPCSTADAEQMRQAAQFDAKNPSFLFSPDSTDKQAQATARIQQMADKWVGPLYEELEALRQAMG